ncbi:hypothetical protein F2981_31625 (plasmid) [Sinorhizobium meliloti]|nr:hypothetical protein [Sinorhizobium meliloti]
MQASAIDVCSKTKSTLEKLGLSRRHPHRRALFAAIDGALTPPQPTDLPRRSAAPSPGPAELRAVGVAELLVVKQQINVTKPANPRNRKRSQRRIQAPYAPPAQRTKR